MTDSKVPNKVSQKQIELAAKRFKELFAPTGSVAIDLMSDFKLLVACSKDDGTQATRSAVHAEIDRVLNARKVKNDKWRAENPRATEIVSA